MKKFPYVNKEDSRFDILCGKGRGEFEKFISAPRLAHILRTGFLAIKDSPAQYLSFFRTIYEKKINVPEIKEYVIPKKIHQIWVGPNPLPSTIEQYQKTFRDNHPDWEYKLWMDKDVVDLELQNRELYEKVSNFGEKSDILRLELLYKFGGVYLDMDCESIRPLDELHKKFDFYAALRPIRESNYTAVMNGMVGAQAHHPLIKKAMDYITKAHDADVELASKNSTFFKKILQRFSYIIDSLYGAKAQPPFVKKITDLLKDSNYGSSTLIRTGPPFFTKIIYNFPELLGERSIILPPVYLSPFSNPNQPWTFSATDKIMPETFIVHQWDATWTK